MAETAQFIQFKGDILADDGRTNVRHVTAHPLQQIAMPGLTRGNLLIYVPGDQLKQALQSRIQTMQIQSNRIQIEVLIPRGPPGLLPRQKHSLNYAVQINHFVSNPLYQLFKDNVHNSTPCR